MASPVDDLLVDFRVRLPEFVATADSVVEFALGDALLIYALCDTGVLYLAAHILTLHAESGVGSTGGTVDGGDGETTSESAGGVSASFKAMADTGSEAFFATTAYGRMFLTIRKTSVGHAFSVRIG